MLRRIAETAGAIVLGLIINWLGQDPAKAIEAVAAVGIGAIYLERRRTMSRQLIFGAPNAVCLRHAKTDANELFYRLPITNPGPSTGVDVRLVRSDFPTRADKPKLHRQNATVHDEGFILRRGVTQSYDLVSVADSGARISSTSGNFRVSFVAASGYQKVPQCLPNDADPHYHIWTNPVSPFWEEFDPPKSAVLTIVAYGDGSHTEAKYRITRQGADSLSVEGPLPKSSRFGGLLAWRKAGSGR